MSRPICPGCNKEMVESDVADFECKDGCQEWVFDEPEDGEVESNG